MTARNPLDNVPARKPTEDDLRMALTLWSMDRAASTSWSGAVRVHEVKLRLGDTTRFETLVILTGVDDENTPLVAFHSGCPPSEALTGAFRRLMNGTLSWKVDQYALERRARDQARGADDGG